MRCSALQGNRQTGPVTVDTTKELGRGATATIYKASLDGKIYAAKIYNAAKGDSLSKVEAMLTNPPGSVFIEFAGATYPQLAWPTALLKSEQGHAVGYLMPLVDLEESFPLDYYYDQALFKKLNAPDEVALSYKLEIARNLAFIVADLHKHGHNFIDLKPQNIRVFRRTHIVTLVDCDGFSVRSESGTRFPAELISTDYISPEAFRNQIAPKDLSENQDRYALAVILFQLLNQGTHPFQGILQDENGPNTNDEKAAAGLYPHGLVANSKISPRPQSTHLLWTDATRALFDKAFEGGPAERPSALEWATHFDHLLKEKALVRCDKEPLNLAHMRFKDKACPTCYLHSLPALAHKSMSNTNKNTSTKLFVNTPRVKHRGINNFIVNNTKAVLAWGIIVAIFLIAMLINKNNISENHTNNNNVSDNHTNPPSEKAKMLVTEGWLYMSPSLNTKDYKRAFDLNKEAYKLGHLEGASNIGLLYEYGWGVDRNPNTALEWYKIATGGYFHSAQAELGIARILLTPPVNVKSIAAADDWLKKARIQAEHPWWGEARKSYINEAEHLEAFLKNHQRANSVASKGTQSPTNIKSPQGGPRSYNYISVFGGSDLAIGWSLATKKTESLADSEAQSNCEKFSKNGDCHKIASTNTSNCIAIARSSGRMAVAWGERINEVKESALSACKKSSELPCNFDLEYCQY